MKTMHTIRELNEILRARYDAGRYIKHYQGDKKDETHITTDKMPSTNSPGRIFAGYTDDLLRLDGGTFYGNR